MLEKLNIESEHMEDNTETLFKAKPIEGVQEANRGGDYFDFEAQGEKAKTEVPETKSSGETPSFSRPFSEEKSPNPHIMLKKELRSLKRANYDVISKKFPKAFVIMNKKNGLVLEIVAASPVHACNLVGWRLKNTELLDVIKAEEVGKGNWREKKEKEMQEESHAKQQGQSDQSAESAESTESAKPQLDTVNIQSN